MLIASGILPKASSCARLVTRDSITGSGNPFSIWPVTSNVIGFCAWFDQEPADVHRIADSKFWFAEEAKKKPAEGAKKKPAEGAKKKPESCYFTVAGHTKLFKQESLQSENV